MLQILPYASAVLLTFLVTLSAFPAITMQVNLNISSQQSSKVNFLTIGSTNSRLSQLLDIRCGEASSMFLWPAFYFSILAIMSAGFCSTHPPIWARFWPSHLTPIQVSGGAGPVAKTRQAGFLHHPWTCSGKVCTWLVTIPRTFKRFPKIRKRVTKTYQCKPKLVTRNISNIKKS